MKYIWYVYMLTSPLSFLNGSELATVTNKTITQNRITNPTIRIDYCKDYKVITCPTATIFDEDCFIYEAVFFGITQTNENIRKGIIGKAVEEYAAIGRKRLYRTKEPITIIQKIHSKL